MTEARQAVIFDIVVITAGGEVTHPALKYTDGKPPNNIQFIVDCTKPDKERGYDHTISVVISGPCP